MAPDADETSTGSIFVGGMNSSNDVIPATPPPADMPPSSQVALPSTEDPGSPMDPDVSFKTEANEDRPDAVPSSLTPPPSTQVINNAASNPPANTHAPPSSQRSGLFSPPTTVPQTAPRRATIASGGEYVPPTPQEVREAAPDALRAMMQEAIAENSRLKMETAHYKLQLNLASLQAGEDAKRAAVEHDMARREVEALRDGESARQARRELSAATESARSKYLQARAMYEEAAGEVEHLERRLRLAKKVIQQQEDEICRLREDRHQLRIRIRENREHFNMLCSPGGIFHGVLSPKQGAPSQNRGTPKEAPRQAHGKPEATQHRFDALLQVLSQENNSAPSTPTSGKKAAPRPPSKHTRNVQSLSSLPTTPTAARPGALLPSVQLAPRTEPRHVGGRRLLPDSPRRGEERRSRESTISVPDNEELARQALASVQKASSSLSRLSGAGRIPEGEEVDVGQSRASAAASEMLRRDGASFERAEGVEKRRISEGRGEGSPTKRARVQERLGLGIQY